MSGSTEIITQINDNDIICGRKGVALKHAGNLAYRKIVGLNKELYATCLKQEKLRVSKSIVAAMREAGGRFLEREDRKTSASLDEMDEDGRPVAWRDIGDRKAVEKTSQALREGQPKLLRKLAQKQFINAVHPQAHQYHNAVHPQAHQYHNAVYPQAHQYHAASLNPSIPTMNHSMPTLNPAMSPNYQLNPYAAQTVTPPPSSVLPQLLSQLDTSDLITLALLQRMNGGR